jgi:hypothetical protein
MIVNSTYCRPRNIARRAIKTFIKSYNIPSPRVLDVERNIIVYYWDNVFNDECFLKLIMTNHSYGCGISSKLDLIPQLYMHPYTKKDNVEEVIVDVLKLWFDHQSWARI